MPDRRFLGGALALAILVSACAREDSGLRPPGFNGGAARFFFPTSLARSPVRDSLIVVNSDFSRAFTAATIVEIPLSTFDDAASQPDRTLEAFGDAVLSQGLIHRFGNGLVGTPSALYLVSADPDALMRVPLAASGAISCPENDCRTEAVDLSDVDMEDPSSLALASLTLPGASAPEPVLLVAHTAPTLDPDDDDLGLPARVAVVPERLAIAAAEPFSNGAFTVETGPAATSLVFDPLTRRTFLGGCFEVVQGVTVSCERIQESAFAGSNPLRSFSPELGASAPVEQFSLGGAVGGGNVTAMALSSDGSSLYALTTRPDALVAIATPLPGSPASQRPALVVALPAVPRALALVPTAGGDLVAITSLESDALLLVDPRSGQVVRQIRPVGPSPFGLAVTPTADGHRLFVSLFDGCGVAAVDIPDEDPSAAAHVATVGSCP